MIMGAVGGRRVRAVTHLDVDADGIQTALRRARTGVRSMKLEGIHHITAITGDAPRNVDFYVRLLGLRLVKKSVNQDDPTVYHLFYADEHGSAGSDLTFFEYPNARVGRAGAGMVHRIVHRVGSAETLSFWEDRFGAEGVEVERVRERAALRRLRGPAARVAGRRRAGPAVGLAVDRGAGRARAARVPRGARVRSPIRASPRSTCARRWRSTRPVRTRSRRGAPRAAGRSCSSRRRAAGSAAPGRSTTSRGPRRWTTTRRGGSGWRRPVRR